VTFVPEGTNLTYLVPTAEDAAREDAWMDPDFDNLGWVGTDPPKPIQITEAGTVFDFVEIQNVSADMVDTTGWVVAINNSLGREPDINKMHSTLWPLPDSMTPGEVLYRHDDPEEDPDDPAYHDDYWGEVIPWKTAGPGWVAMLDDDGNVVDFVIWEYSAEEMATFSVNVNGFDVSIADAWIGESVPSEGERDHSLQRRGDSDSNNLNDWGFATPITMAEANAELSTPFPSGPSTGIGFSSDPEGIAGLVRTDVSANMHDVNSSVWMRIPFQADDLTMLNGLNLWMKYEDGFVAYLNGVEVARRNAPENPAGADGLPWNAAALTDRPSQDVEVFEDIDITAHLDALQPGRNLLAIHGLNDGASDGEFLILPRLIASSDEDVMRYMPVPSPGGPNESSTSGVGALFSRTGGTFSQPFMLELAAESPSAVIRYTLDGSIPMTNSPFYTSPISISTTTQVRARVYEGDGDPSPTVTETYVQLAGDLWNFNSQLPLVIVDTLGPAGIGANALSSAYMAIFEPVDGMTTMNGVADLGTRMGIKTRGSSSGGWPKHHYAVEAWDQFDEDKDISPLGMPDESDWILSSFYEFDRAFMRNPLIYELSRQAGRWASRTEYCEVFVNSGGGPLSGSDYLGVYAFMEKIKRDPERVDIDRLDPIPEHNDAPEVTGGYILKIDRADPGDGGFNAGGETYRYVEPKEIEMEMLDRDGQETYIRNFMTQFASAAYGSNYSHPTLGFRGFIDVDSWIDHHWLNVVPKNADAFRLSGYMYKDRNGLLEGGPLWDFDRSMESTDGRDNDWNTWTGGTAFFTFAWWDRLFLDNDFSQRWVDRWYELRQDVFSVENIHGVMDRFAEEIGQDAADRNFAKWSSKQPRFGSWLGEVNHLKSWLENRVNWIDGHFLRPPVFSPSGGTIDPGFRFSMGAPAGTIYYTTDGTDPRAPGGTVSASARVYSTPIALTETTTITARAWNGAPLVVSSSGPSGGWSAPVETEFFVGEAASAANLVVSEINYNPYALTTDEKNANFTNKEAFEFIELCNVGELPIYLGGVEIADGIEFSFTDSGVDMLDPGQHIVVARDRAAFTARYGSGATMVGGYDMNFNNNGERILLTDRFGDPIVDFSYGDGGNWPGRADGKGATLELIAPDEVPSIEPHRSEYLSNDNFWRSTSEYGGTPGSQGVGPLDTVVINEVLTHTDWPQTDTIELYNPTDGAIDISGWLLSDSIDNYDKFRIPDGTTIPAGGYLVYDEDDFNPNPDPTDPDSTSFALDGAHGDDVWLMRVDATGTITHFADHVDFPAAANGESFGRWPNGSGDLYPMVHPPTLDPADGENLGPRIGPIIFSEVHYNPGNFAGALSLEFVEIHNPTAAEVDLTDWQIGDGIDYHFVDGTVLSSGASLVVVPFYPSDVDELTAFHDYYDIDESVQIVGPFFRQLDNGGETLQLLRPDELPEGEEELPEGEEELPYLLEDEVVYDDEGSWPLLADGWGASLNRLATSAWGNDGENWRAFGPTPGTAPLLSTAGVVGRHVFYNNSTGFDPAIATDKEALLPGHTASFANYTSFNRGINGILIDITDLPDDAVLNGDDFEFRVGNGDDLNTWIAAPNPALIAVSTDGGTGGSDRVQITWADNDIQNQWLEVTVLANFDTRLSENDVFYFGNAIGETGNSPTDAKVNATDLLLARNNPRGFLNSAPIDFSCDFNRDARVNATDLLIARNNQTHFLDALKLITVSGSPVKAGTAGADSSLLYGFEGTTELQQREKERTPEDAVDELLSTDW